MSKTLNTIRLSAHLYFAPILSLKGLQHWLLPRNRLRLLLMSVAIVFAIALFIGNGVSITPAVKTVYAKDVIGKSRQTEWLQRMLKQNGNLKLVQIASKDVEGIHEAAEGLRHNECASAVHMRWNRLAIARLYRTRYYAFPAGVASGEKGEQLQVTFAASNSPAQRTLLFPAFLDPERTPLSLPEGGTATVNIIPDFERLYRLKPGAVTPRVVQAITLLEEQDAFNGDSPSLEPRTAMLRTYKIVQACFPETLLP